MTAHYLIHLTHKVRGGDLLLLHSAAGGVGQILARWATAKGATVIGITGSPQKRAAILAADCNAAIDLGDADWPAAFLQATGGRKANVVYDSVGKGTLLKSFDCGAPFGLVMSYGAASGQPPAVEPDLLRQKGNLFFTAPSVFDHNADARSLRTHAGELFDAITRGHVAVDIGRRFTFDQIIDVNRPAEARQIEGAIVITP